MMRANLKKMLIGIIAALFCACMALSATVFYADAEGAEYEFPIEESYTVGESLTLPGCEIENVAAQPYVLYPDGNYKKTGNIVFSRAGKYVITYQATVNGALVSEEKVVYAYEEKYFSDKNSDNIEYQADKEFSIDAAGSVATADGLYVELSEGGVFTYNKIFDLTGKTKDDVIFSCNIMATTPTYADFWELTVRFSDVYDPENYVDVVLWHNGNSTDHDYDILLDSINYVRAGASNQTPTGYSPNDRNPDGSLGVYHVGRYGNWAYVSMMSNSADKNNLTDTFDISFDYAEKKVYGPEKSMVGKNMICDLDDPVFFGENLWEGFTNGKCRVSVFAREYQTVKGALFIRNIFDDSGEDFQDNLLTEPNVPSINVDTGNYGENLPFAVVGKPYKVFDAQADNMGAYCSPVTCNVYFNYNSGNPISVNLEDGKFIPEIPGGYTIVYSVTDGFGETFTEKINITCIGDNNPMQLILDEEKVTSADTGALIDVAGYEILNESGDVSVEIKAVCGDISYNIGEDLSFRPFESGVYTIQYKITDYAGQTDEISYEVDVSPLDEPLFIDEILLPEYFIAGYKQNLPALQAYDFKDGGNVIQAKVFVKEGDNPEREITGDFIPAVTGENYTLEIIYRAQGKFGTGQTVFRRECCSIYSDAGENYLDTKKLFATDGDISADYIEIDYTNYATYTTTADGASMTYINPIPANVFEAEFNVNGNAFDKLNFYLSDAVDGRTVKATVEKYNSESVYFSVNDGVKVIVSGISFDNADRAFNISYNNLTQKFTVNFTDEFSVNTYTDGTLFNGFESGKVYFEMEFEGVTGQASVIMKKVANQQLIDYIYDSTEPLLTLNGEYDKSYDIGDTVSVISAVCLDMIDPSIGATLTVYDPDGNIMKDTGGRTLSGVDISVNYEIKLSAYGRYKISYAISGTSDPLDFFITVVDREKPEIQIKNKINASYNVNDKISLAADATDNMGGELKLIVCVETPDSITEYVTDGEYTFRSEGKYKIIFTALDSRGNCGQVIYETVVG